jgi:signal transduction histidine kinase
MDGDLGAITDTQKDIIKKGFESNESMIKMLADVSHANHSSEWAMHFNLQPMDITPCIESTLTEFVGEAKSKNIVLHFQKKYPLPPVLADKDRICLVVQNLVENAIKYNQVNGSITIGAEKFSDKLVISVTDTGIGIPVEDQKKVFGKFYRASNTTKEKGTGLGLFVGKQIIEGHHGHLWFESTPNIGTTFFFSLPLA